MVETEIVASIHMSSHKKTMFLAIASYGLEAVSSIWSANSSGKFELIKDVLTVGTRYTYWHNSCADWILTPRCHGRHIHKVPWRHSRNVCSSKSGSHVAKTTLKWHVLFFLFQRIRQVLTRIRTIGRSSKFPPKCCNSSRRLEVSKWYNSWTLIGLLVWPIWSLMVTQTFVQCKDKSFDETSYLPLALSQGRLSWQRQLLPVKLESTG